ncbi:MAG: DUF4852 domain-containing protein [Alphaproteobacteria bacterium]|nr:DUF4852 domain-containing protein [Alphaproteobacteria bacterium]
MKSKLCLKTLCLGMALSLALLAPCAHAYDFKKPNLQNIIKTLIRFGAVDIYDDHIIDIYARLNECDLYLKYFRNEFVWEQIRAKLREIIQRDVKTFPVAYFYDTSLSLDRYDFKNKIYPFINQSANENVNSFVMATNKEDFCVKEKVEGFPTNFRLVLRSPVSVPKLPLTEREGAALFNRLQADENALNHSVSKQQGASRRSSTIQIEPNRIYVRFNFRVVYIAAIAMPNVGISDKAKVGQKIVLNTVNFDSQLDSIEFFEDEARTRLLYAHRF